MGMETEIKQEICEIFKNDPNLGGMAPDWATHHVFERIREFGIRGRVQGRLPFVEVGDSQPAGQESDGMVGVTEILEYPVRASSSEAQIEDLYSRVDNAIRNQDAKGGMLNHARVVIVEIDVGERQGTKRRHFVDMTIRVTVIYKKGCR